MANPYKLGFIGSSNAHVAAGVFSEEDYTGPSGLMQGNGERRVSVPVAATATGEAVDDGSGRSYSSTTAITNVGSGLAGVWANENTRESLFDAMRRKETFATSGTRIQVRFFAGVGIGTLDFDAPPSSRRPTSEGCRWVGTCLRVARPRRVSSSGR